MYKESLNSNHFNCFKDAVFQGHTTHILHVKLRAPKRAVKTNTGVDIRNWEVCPWIQQDGDKPKKEAGRLSLFPHAEGGSCNCGNSLGFRYTSILAWDPSVRQCHVQAMRSWTSSAISPAALWKERNESSAPCLVRRFDAMTYLKHFVNGKAL